MDQPRIRILSDDSPDNFNININVVHKKKAIFSNIIIKKSEQISDYIISNIFNSNNEITQNSIIISNNEINRKLCLSNIPKIVSNFYLIGFNNIGGQTTSFTYLDVLLNLNNSYNITLNTNIGIITLTLNRNELQSQ